MHDSNNHKGLFRPWLHIIKQSTVDFKDYMYLKKSKNVLIKYLCCCILKWCNSDFLKHKVHTSWGINSWHLALRKKKIFQNPSMPQWNLCSSHIHCCRVRKIIVDFHIRRNWGGGGGGGGELIFFSLGVLPPPPLLVLPKRAQQIFIRVLEQNNVV